MHFFTSWDLEEEEAEADLEQLVYILQQLQRAGLISTQFFSGCDSGPWPHAATGPYSFTSCLQGSGLMQISSCTRTER